MRITLEIDDSAIPRIAGEETGKMILQHLQDDPCFWVNAADSLCVVGAFGKDEVTR